MIATSRDFKNAVEYGLIVESRLEWRPRQYVITVHKFADSVLTVHRIVFDQFIRFEWTDKDRDLWISWS